jgi:hypothetical protein
MIEVGWVLGYLSDLESDFSAFHRVSDMYAMESTKFLRLAARIFAYGGVMTSRFRRQSDNVVADTDDVEEMRNQARSRDFPGYGEVRHVSISEQIRASA